ncbi:LysE family translocator [Bacillus cereus]|uniref:LysE family translocator n=1 Tax=Bacillus cereus TaxID=1396 RepID=A0AAW4R6T0_BACCE|nr:MULTISPECIES: LysE family translocator [Bacillus]KAB7654146.1 LysE family translocator [Bacillus sp. B2-WWTP-C-10-Post-4]MBY0040677.1 LysE family translocator [Bacillus cereus]MCU4995732.1 LysE family translocator [Bacillus cereus]MDA2266286.1 LysE family translocator [Bacillus cereus]MDC7774449.1 LysE family translocator [Bacillus cereus]
MVSLSTLIAFAIVSLSMVCSPGPNIIYLISRSITQGRMAGFISLLSIMLGFVIYIIATMFGLTVLFLAVPAVYEAVKWAGAAYLLWLAWNSIKPGAISIMEPRTISNEPPRKLFLMGLMTNLLNPKIAILYVSLLPQFEDPEKGSLLFQGAVLGLTQITVSFIVNLLIVCTASKIAKWFGTRPTWLRVQRWLMASVLTGLAVRLAFERRQ